jgi:membrane protease YdiL (CAAX protease family)
MIRHDNISYMLMIFSIGVTIYLATATTTVVVVFPALLLLTGWFGERIIERRSAKPEEDPSLSKTEYKSILFYGLLAVAGTFIMGYAIQNVHLFGTVEGMQLSALDSLLYTVLIAVGEEEFFRGFVTEALLNLKMPAKFGLFNTPYVALLMSAFLFCGYHFARYGTNPDALMYVFAGGFVLSWVAWRSRRISTTMIGHGLNNLLAWCGV